nr:pyruvate formate lyase family protein [Escherichia coli]
MTDGGARYNFSGVQGIGIATLSDSLHALKGMIFDQQSLSFDEMLSVIKDNSQTYERQTERPPHNYPTTQTRKRQVTLRQETTQP